MRCFLVSLLLLSSTAWSQVTKGPSASVGGILINSDEMYRDSVKKTVRLKGQVQLVFQGYYLSCDEATIYLDRKEIEAIGNVIVKTDQIHSEGSKVILNYETKLGTFYDGFIQAGNVVFEGNIVEKTGDHEYFATKAKYTACATCPPDWSFTGDTITAEIDGYARIKHPILRIRGIPVFWLPRLIVPLKSSRQSGFLVPTWETSSTGGFTLSESFFWAISRSQDMTLTARHYQFRGPKGLMEYRYVLDENSRGQFHTAYISDRAFANPTEGDSQPRWFLDYNHVYQLPDGFVNRLQIKNVSDLRYPRDFPDELGGHGDPALVNRASVTKNLERSHFSVEGMLYMNLLQSDPLAKNDNAVQRLPELRYSLTESHILDSNFLFNLNINYVNFAREGFAYDDINDTDLGDPACPNLPTGGSTTECLKEQRDGEFNPDRDIMRVGQRLDIQPSLAYPISFAQYFSIYPSVTYRETQYRFPVPEELPGNSNFSASAARRYLDLGVSARTRFDRIFGDRLDPKAERIKHEIEPEVAYTTVPWSRYPNHDFFGDPLGQEYSQILDPVSDKDAFGVNGLQFDYEDRSFNKQKVDFSLINRWSRRRWIGDEAEYRQIAIFRLLQSYDFREAKSESPQPWSAITGLLDVRFDRFETNSLVVHYPYAKVTNNSSRVKFISEHGDFMQFTYSKSVGVESGNLVNRDSRTEDYGAGLGLITRWLNLSGKVDYSNITNKIRSWEYGVFFNSPGRCWDITFSQKQVIGGDLIFNFNFAFKFDGETTASTSWL